MCKLQNPMLQFGLTSPLQQLLEAVVAVLLGCRMQVGVELEENGSIKVDDQNRTTVSSIYAIGDVCTKLPLTPVARMEGTYLARRLFG